MSLRRFFARVWSVRKQENIQKDLDEEIHTHLEIEEEEQRAAGLSPDEARDAARRAFGNVMRSKETSRDMWIFRRFEELGKDLRYALRQMARNKGFAAVATLTLALGIGANVAIFSLLDAIVLRMLPVQHPEQLYLLHWNSKGQAYLVWNSYSTGGGCGGIDAGSGNTNCSFSYPVFENFRDHAKSLESVAAYGDDTRVLLDVDGHFSSTDVQTVSGNFFNALEVSPLLGRMLNEADDQPGAEPVAVLGFDYWQKQFDGDPKIVGKTIRMNEAAFTVAGVSPPEFFGLQPGSRTHIWVALHSRSLLDKEMKDLYDAHLAWLFVFGRVKANVRAEQAGEEMTVLFRSALADEAGADATSNDSKGAPPPRGSPSNMTVTIANVEHGLTGIRDEYSPQLFALFAITGLVLLIACANIANLLLARASARRHEIAVRLAVGAGRGRLLRQLMTESILLAGAGGGAGLLLSIWLTHVLAVVILDKTAVILLPSLWPEPRAFGFVLGAAALSSIIFGLAPALACTRTGANAVLKVSDGRAAGTIKAGRAFVIGEIAVALVLLVGAGLFVRTLINLETLNPGFRVDHLLTFSTGRANLNSPADRPAALPELLRDRLVALPGVKNATWVSAVLLTGSMSSMSFQLKVGDKVESVSAETLRIGPEFFETMGIPILAGRSIEQADLAHDKVVWINRAMAQRYFPNNDALGKQILKDKEIVGVVGDTKYQSLRDDVEPTIFQPSQGGAYLNFEMRTAGDPMALEKNVRGIVAETAPAAVIQDMETHAEAVDESIAGERAMARLSAAFGLLALVLTSVGVYGVLAYSVARRTSEIAIRMSLGAMPGDILNLVVREGMWPAIAGAAAGLLGAYGLTRLVEKFLFGVKPLDPLTFVCATLLLLGVAVLACYFPARRAMRVEPMTALRYE